jgi:hypothetical protein
MRSRFMLLACVAAAGAVAACKSEITRSTSTSTTGTEDVAGTYFAADSGHNLGEDWCYSAALVLDSTKHFGSVVRMCSDDGSGPDTENIKGTYAVLTSTVKAGNGARVRKVRVVLSQDGSRRKRHTLVYDNGALRFDEPWWMGAGLRALEIADPTLRKISSAAAADSSVTGPASSTPATTKAAKKKT